MTAQAIVTKSTTRVRGHRFHLISFEPWSGGPSATITWSVPRKCITLCPSNETSRNDGSGEEAAATAPLPEAASAGNANDATATEPRKEREETGGDGALLWPPVDKVQVYPAGTVVVVRSVETDPGRTLKFARGETYEAAFQELLGREVGWNEVEGAEWRRGLEWRRLLRS